MIWSVYKSSLIVSAKADSDYTDIIAHLYERYLTNTKDVEEIYKLML